MGLLSRASNLRDRITQISLVDLIKSYFVWISEDGERFFVCQFLEFVLLGFREQREEFIEFSCVFFCFEAFFLLEAFFVFGVRQDLFLLADESVL